MNIIKKAKIKVQREKKENPKFYDWMLKGIEISWFFVSTFLGGIASNTVVTIVIIMATFIVIYIAEGKRLTSKYEREKTMLIKTSKRDIKKVREYYEETVLFMHAVAHETKINTAQMSSQQLGAVRNSMISFFYELLNTLEELLSKCYNQKICASIKLCTTDGKIRSCARGQNNIKSRGGEARVKILDLKSVPIEENYAYNAIIKQKLKYFSEGDLKCLKRKEKEDDKFFCEYGEEWWKFFRASIIIPIRYPIILDAEMSYKILGLICIDAPKIQTSWSEAEDSYAYQLVAYVADVIYWQLENYIQIQKKYNNIISRRKLKNER